MQIELLGRKVHINRTKSFVFTKDMKLKIVHSLLDGVREGYILHSSKKVLAEWSVNLLIN